METVWIWVTISWHHSQTCFKQCQAMFWIYFIFIDLSFCRLNSDWIYESSPRSSIEEWLGDIRNVVDGGYLLSVLRYSYYLYLWLHLAPGLTSVPERAEGNREELVSYNKLLYQTTGCCCTLLKSRCWLSNNLSIFRSVTCFQPILPTYQQ